MNVNEFIKNSRLKLVVKTNSAKTEIVEYYCSKDAVKVNVNAQPENNKANIEIVKFFRKLLKKNVKMVSGFKSKEKVLLID